MTSKLTEIRTTTQGLIGYLYEVECKSLDSMLVFQLPRQTSMLSEGYKSNAMNSLRDFLPKGKTALVIGADVNIYELAGEDAIILKLKGLI